MYSLGILLPDIREYYGATQDQANLVISLNTGLLFLCGPTVAGLSNKFGIRTVIMVGSVCGALTFYLSTLSPNIFVMMVLFGVFAGLCRPHAYMHPISKYFQHLFNSKAYLWDPCIYHHFGACQCISARKGVLPLESQWLAVVRIY
jgi:hypothetical protein